MIIVISSSYYADLTIHFSKMDFLDSKAMCDFHHHLTFSPSNVETIYTVCSVSVLMIIQYRAALKW